MTDSAAPRRRRRRPRAGKKLRADLDEAQAAAAEERGEELEWSEQELLVIERAAAAADRGETLQWLWDEELARDAHPTTLVKLSAEIRACERQVVDLISKVNPAVGVAKSERHVRAANARYGIRGVVR